MFGCSLLFLQIEIIIHLMKHNKHPSTRPILCGISNIRWVIVGVIVGVLVGVSWLGRWVGGRPGSIRTRKAAQAEQLATLSLLDDHPAGARLRLTPGHASCSSTRARHRAPPSCLGKFELSFLRLGPKRLTPRHPCCTGPVPDTTGTPQEAG